ncbi:DMT family transporter [Sediminibacterium soli]|uniref:DMT family transporter n=1 Tax=Sediminibacterium soli TaxID=2698829 RepID=UPI00137A822B|nr:DMT family transporter [Sediminibacterium soli]NCI46834.1 DMT family transporter [Sediminibacterium soli]
MTDKQKAIIAVLLGNFFFGTSVIAVKHITPSLMPPIALTAVRVVSTTILFWLMYAVRPVKTGIVAKDYRLLFLCAIAGIVMNQTFSIRGMSLTSPIHASLLILTTPITITLLAAWVLREKLTRFKLMGLALGVCGGALLVFSRDLSDKAGGQQLLGDLFAIMGAISYSLYVVFIRPVMPKYKAAHILQWVFLFGCLFSLPLGWNALKEVQWQAFDALSWFSLVYVVLGATFIAYQLMNYSINKLGASGTGAFIYTQPFFATMASMILLNESLSLPKILAAALIMGGVFLTNYRRK